MLAFGAFFYAGGTLKTEVTAITASAAEYPDAFESIKGVITSGSAPQLFSTESLDDPANYSLLDVSIILTNRGIFDAEWLNVQFQGVQGDVAVYSLSGDTQDVLARGAAQVNLKLITNASASGQRMITIQYYVYGISRTIEVPVFIP